MAPTEEGEGRGHTVAAARLQLVFQHAITAVKRAAEFVPNTSYNYY